MQLAVRTRKARSNDAPELDCWGMRRARPDKMTRMPISKQRNKHLQRVLIEAAKLAVRKWHELAVTRARELERATATGPRWRLPGSSLKAFPDKGKAKTSGFIDAQTARSGSRRLGEGALYSPAECRCESRSYLSTSVAHVPMRAILRQVAARSQGSGDFRSGAPVNPVRMRESARNM